MRCDCIAALVILACGSAAAGPHRIALDGAHDMGVVAASHSTLTASYAYRLWDDQVYAEGRLGAGVSDAGEGRMATMLIFEARVGAGLILARERKFEFRIGWRLGDTYHHGWLNGMPFDLHVFAIQLAPSVAARLDAAWRLRITPLAPTLYYNGTYGGGIGIELGVERAL
jgi:hypothetical protein